MNDDDDDDLWMRNIYRERERKVKALNFLFYYSVGVCVFVLSNEMEMDEK